MLHRSKILSGAPFITSKWRGSLGSSLSWIDTWYLLVELKGISQTFLFLFLMDKTSPRASSMHLRRAASEASPATSFFRIGTPSWPPLNSARLHRVAILARALKPGLVRSVNKILHHLFKIFACYSFTLLITHIGCTLSYILWYYICNVQENVDFYVCNK